MTTATSSNITYGGLYLRGGEVNEALAWRGLNVFDDGRPALCLTGYAPGVTVEIVFNNTDEFLTFARTITQIADHLAEVEA